MLCVLCVQTCLVSSLTQLLGQRRKRGRMDYGTDSEDTKAVDQRMFALAFLSLCGHVNVLHFIWPS